MIEVAHYSALAPLLFLLAFRREAPSPYWIVALGFSVSWFADWGTILLDGSWALTYVYPALQLGLFAWALGAPWVVALLVLLAGIQIIAMPLEGPEVWVTLLGSMFAIALAINHPLLWTMVAYCGLATCFYLLLVTELFRPSYMPLWYGYQGSRLLAFGLFGRAAWLSAK